MSSGHRSLEQLRGNVEAGAVLADLLAMLTRSSPVLSAWTVQIYVGYEAAIAELVTPRIADLRVDDPRPRLIGARRTR